MASAQERALAGTVATVTGGGRGLGELIAQALADAGAAVGVVGRSSRDLEQTVGSITSAGGVAEAASADVTDEARITRAFSRLRDRLGPPDLLVNNAGVAGPMGRSWEVDDATWWRAVEVNLRGVLICSRLVIPTMISEGSGRIVNLTSRAGVVPSPGLSAYSVSKCAVVKLTENLAMELEDSGVVVLSLDPGVLPIGLTGAALKSPPGQEWPGRRVAEWVRREQAAGRGAEPEEFAEVMVALARGRGDAMSGRHLTVHDDLEMLSKRLGEEPDSDLHLLRLDE